MGCHTWFNRPMTNEEYAWMKEYALEDAFRCFSYNTIRENNLEDKSLSKREIVALMSSEDKYCIELINKSLATDEACYYGMTWYEAGFGSGNPKFIEKNGAKPYIYYIKSRKKTGKNALYMDVGFDYAYLDKFYNGISSEEFWKSDIPKQIDFPYFHDTFRVNNYPNKVIHSRKELRKWLGKKYFELNEYQLKRISMFFKLYPGGVITFG